MKIMLLCIPLLFPVAALAQFKCTMPSGVVIFNRLSACPSDAVKSESLDRVPDSVQPQFKGDYREPPPPEPARPGLPWPAQTKPAPAPAKPVERDILDEAYGVCSFLKSKGATSCKVEVNIFSPSYIDATVPVSPDIAKWVCIGVTNTTRKTGSPFIGRGWKLKLFSPYGAGTRPIAECTL